MQKWLIGIDEAGRGPLAGPVAVGVVLLPPAFDWTAIDGVADSKTLTEGKREEVWHAACALQRAGLLDFEVTLAGHAYIDRRGIVPAIRHGMARSLRSLLSRNGIDQGAVTVRLDGALRAPSSFRDQTTIIRGDATEACIGLASILAKVTRDRYMVQLSRKYPQYGFEMHKGYGTLLHRTRIQEYGLSDIHRRSFCRNLQN